MRRKPTRRPARELGRSPQAVDPLSWFTGPLAPLTFGALIVTLGPLQVFTVEGGSSAVFVQLIAIALCASACVLIHFATRPKRPPIDWITSSIALLISLCGYLLSGLSYGAAGQSVEQWWAPGAVALAVVSLAPYVSLRRLVTLGLTATLLVGIVGIGVFPSGSGVWSVAGVFAIVSTAPLLAVAASSVFIVTVVRTMQRLLSERENSGEGRANLGSANLGSANLKSANLKSRDLEGADREGADLEDRTLEDTASAAERDALARLTARVTPFLEQLAETGSVTATDRAVAGQLARRLRDELVSRANASWLDSLATGRPMVVMDPENRADGMNEAQKSALTGLITAILDAPDTASKSVLVELRGQKNGATAVGVSMDLTLPEGRRTMHLAPYYLTLKTAFEGLSWSEGRLMNMRFEVPSTDVDGGTAS